jgi:hypothetical protein
MRPVDGNVAVIFDSALDPPVVILEHGSKTTSNCAFNRSRMKFLAILFFASFLVLRPRNFVEHLGMAECTG